MRVQREEDEVKDMEHRPSPHSSWRRSRHMDEERRRANWEQKINL